MMWIRVVLAGIGLGVALIVAIVSINSLRLNQRNQRLVEELIAERRPATPEVFHAGDVAGLPDPVRRYLVKAIPEGQPYVTATRLHQVGDFRLGDASAPWKPLEAEQTFVVGRPGFVWDAKIEMAPLTAARVIDAYQAGAGMLQAHIFSTLKVADAPTSPELDSGELMRYLGEAVWFPTALLPGQGVEWSPIDDHAALATIKDGDTGASLVFTFGEDDLVERVNADRWRQTKEGGFELMPWSGHWRNYQQRNGLLIPTEGEAQWNLPNGDLPYWRAAIDEIEHDVGR